MSYGRNAINSHRKCPPHYWVYSGVLGASSRKKVCKVCGMEQRITPTSNSRQIT